MKINFNVEVFGSRKIIMDEFCWYLLTDVEQNPTTISSLVKPEGFMVAIYKTLSLMETIIMLYLRQHNL